MGSKKFWRLLEEGFIKMIRQVAPLVDTIPERCKFCGSRRIVKYRHYQHVQRYWCKDCKRKFVHNEAPLGMKTPAVQIASALSMFYEGMSLNAIRRNLEQTYRNYPSDSTVYE